MSELADIQSAVRELSHQVGGLDATVKTLLTIWQSQEASATAGRRELHQKLEAVSKDVASLDNRVENLSKEVTIIAPSVQAFDDARQQAMGAQKLGKVIWGLIGLGGAGVGSLITWVLANWVSITPKIPPPH